MQSGRGAPLAIVAVMLATGGLLMFDVRWLRLGAPALRRVVVGRDIAAARHHGCRD